MYCWKCGAKIADESAFCAACGAGVQHSASKHREAPQPSASPPVGTVRANDKPGGTSQDAPQSIHGRGTLPTRVEAPDLYAGFWRRAAAFLIDCLVLCVPYAILQAIARSYPAVVLVEILLIWLYYALFESSKLRATPGKLALSLAVVDAQGERIGFWRATGRYLCRFLSFVILMIGYFMAGWTQHKQCLHDMLADTYVVRKKGLDAALGHGLVGDRRPQSATASVVIGLACFLVIVGLSAAGRVGYADYAARSQVRESVSEPTTTTLESSMPAESPAPAPAPAPVAVASVGLGSAVGPDQKVTMPTTMFTSKDTIYASVATNGTGNATIEAKWTYQDGQTVKDDSLAIAATGPANTAFSISKPDGWPAGSYKVEISLNGAAAASKDFSVK